MTASLTTTQAGLGEIRRITITDLGGISGNLTLIFKGFTTPNIAYNANAVAVRAALRTLPNINEPDLIVTDQGLSGNETMDVLIEFTGAYAGEDLSAADFQLGTTPSAASVAFANTRQGGVKAPLTSAAISPAALTTTGA